MNNTNTLLVMISEAAIEASLVEDIKQFGVSGYTISEAHGQGENGIRNAGWIVDSNIRIEIACSLELAQKIGEFFSKKYSKNYAMFIYKHSINIFPKE